MCKDHKNSKQGDGYRTKQSVIKKIAGSSKRFSRNKIEDDE